MLIFPFPLCKAGGAYTLDRCDPAVGTRARPNIAQNICARPLGVGRGASPGETIYEGMQTEAEKPLRRLGQPQRRRPAKIWADSGVLQISYFGTYGRREAALVWG